MSADVFPVMPAQLRRAALEVAELLVLAERALTLPWISVPLAPVPPGARADDPADGAPAEVYLLGRYGSLLAELRVTLDQFLALGQAPEGELWNSSDAAGADSQLPDWRVHTGAMLDSSVMAAAEIRLGALAALRHSIQALRDLTMTPAPGRFNTTLISLHQASVELRQISRAPVAELLARPE